MKLRTCVLNQLPDYSTGLWTALKHWRMDKNRNRTPWVYTRALSAFMYNINNCVFRILSNLYRWVCFLQINIRFEFNEGVFIICFYVMCFHQRHLEPESCRTKKWKCLGRSVESTELELYCIWSPECGFESWSWHLCPLARHLAIASSFGWDVKL